MAVALGAILIALFTGILAGLTHSPRVREWVHLVGSVGTTAVALALVWDVATRGPLTSANQFFHVDALSAIVLLIIAVVGLTASLHSLGYIRHELQEGTMNARQTRQYYLMLHVFMATMILMTVVNNVGLLWVSVEATTLASAFLVAIYHRGEALEAAWKYVMICSAGIALAFLGVIILYASSLQKLGNSNHVLNWTVLVSAHAALQPDLVALAFVFIMVGFGTKVGLVPLHFWLPDAHSQAPSPVSALLSGVLLNCALVGLIRFAIIAEHVVVGHLIQHLFLGFGLLSVLVALPFILVQQDFKRMLAFSTVEHMGIITIALGIGGPLGYSAALLQMFNHAMGKSLLFLIAGNVSQKYRTKQMGRVGGVLRVMPFTGVALLIGTFAITGLPPFSLFSSEFAIFIAGFRQGDGLATGVLIALVALIFAAMLFHSGRMVFGTVERQRVRMGEMSRWTTFPLLLPLVFVVTFGLYVPTAFMQLVGHAALILAGGGGA